MKNKYYCFFSILIISLFFNSYNTLAQENWKNIIDQHRQENNAIKSISSNDLTWEVISSSETKGTDNIVNIYGQQTLNGIPIFKAVSAYTIKNKKVLSFEESFLNLSDFVKRKNKGITKRMAILSLINKLKINQKSIALKEELSPNEAMFTSQNSKEPIRIKLYYLRSGDNILELVWKVELYDQDQNHWWSALVNSTTGEIEFLNDWVLNCTFPNSISRKNTYLSTPNDTFFRANSLLSGEQYRVFPLPLMSPAEGESQLITEPQNLTASPFGWHDTNGADGAEYTITRGNNVWAYEDLDGSGGSEGDSPNGGSSLNFDFPFELNQNPREYLDASTTNLFYINNKIHDITFVNGFDEASGNFQTRNYSGDGVQGDYVNAISQHGSALNNATFATPPDGISPRMRMFIWSAPGPPGDVLTVTSPSSIAGNYSGVPAAIGRPLSTSPIEERIVLVRDNNSSFSSTDENDGCDNILNSGDISGNIALMRRGACDFDEKIKKAQNAGAKAVIIVNNVDGTPVTINGDDTTIFIPSVMINREQGEAIIDILKTGATVNGILQNQGPFQKDGSLDNGIILHEYTHGISNRLTGGPLDSDCLVPCTERDSNGNCISNSYTEQMGEGWSDYFSLLLTLKSEDSANDARLIGSYILSDERTDEEIGLRPFPYSRDLSINPLTYDDTNDASLLSAPHGVGTVWASVLWDLTWDLIDFYGFDPDIYTGNGGNNIALKLIIQGMKMQPCQPGFIDGRDAILAADEALYEGKHKCIIYNTFARRGMVVNPRQGESTSRFDQIENFEVPPEYSENCVLSLKDLEKNANTFNIYPNPSNGQFEIYLNENYGEGVVKVYSLNGKMLFERKNTLEGVLNFDISSLSSGTYIINIKGRNINISRKLLIN